MLSSSHAVVRVAALAAAVATFAGAPSEAEAATFRPIIIPPRITPYRAPPRPYTPPPRPAPPQQSHPAAPAPKPTPPPAAHEPVAPSPPSHLRVVEPKPAVPEAESVPLSKATLPSHPGSAVPEAAPVTKRANIEDVVSSPAQFMHAPFLLHFPPHSQIFSHRTTEEKIAGPGGTVGYMYEVAHTNGRTLTVVSPEPFGSNVTQLRGQIVQRPIGTNTQYIMLLSTNGPAEQPIQSP